MIYFRVVTVSPHARDRHALKPPSFPSSGRENEGAVVGEQSVWHSQPPLGGRTRTLLIRIKFETLVKQGKNSCMK